MPHRTLVLWITALTLLLDQSLKIWVKTNLAYGEEFGIFGLDWALIHFVENEGMAFGLTLGIPYGKLFLNLIRLTAVTMIFIYLRKLIRERADRWLTAGFALIGSGAIGNLIDSIFYGRLFGESAFHGGVAEFLPEGGGYAPLFYGRVVDMFYFPVAYGVYPTWVPLLGGKNYLFFRPVFNLADVAICGGVLLLVYVFFHRLPREKAPPAGVTGREDNSVLVQDGPQSDPPGSTPREDH